MKKQYVNPQMDVINVAMQQVLAASVGFGTGDKTASDAQSREFDPYWDDEDW